MLLAVALVLLSATLAPATVAFHPPDPAELNAIRAELTRLQHLSFATRREYCGYLGHDVNGLIILTPTVRGGRDGCTPVVSGTDLRPVASFHTHGGYDPGVPAEFPTAQDIVSDAHEGVNGYISTPGGRLWYVQADNRRAFLLCGPGCLPQDPAFHAGDDGPIRQTYSLRDLQAMESLP